MRQEAAVTIGSITAVVAAVIALLVAFNIPVTQDQQVAILGIVAAVGPIVAAVVTRSQVFSKKTVEELTGTVQS